MSLSRNGIFFFFFRGWFYSCSWSRVNKGIAFNSIMALVLWMFVCVCVCACCSFFFREKKEQTKRESKNNTFFCFLLQLFLFCFTVINLLNCNSLLIWDYSTGRQRFCFVSFLLLLRICVWNYVLYSTVSLW